MSPDAPARPYAVSDAPAEPSLPRLALPTIRAVELDDGRAVKALLDAVEKTHAAADLGKLERAFHVGREAHEGQMRKSGEPYYVHPVRVAHGITLLGLDTASIAAALLHDVVEDTSLSVYGLTEQFGREVALIVDGVTKLGKVPYLSRQEQQAESFRKMLLAMSQDIRVLIVKLIDRLDNMRTLEHMAPEKRERIARETMQIYAPLAGRLGIEGVRSELQDLSLRYLEPETYEATTADIARMLDANEGAIAHNVQMLAEAFDEGRQARSAAHPLSGADEDMRWNAQLGDVNVRATLRPVLRVHRRLEAAGRGIDQLSDIVSYQVVTQDRTSCYVALGVLHAHLQPAPGRFRDYVAMPRPNHYRALHTSLVGRDGMRLDVQLRSAAMDDVAERGIVASWRGGTPPGSSAGNKLAWIQQLMDWQEDVTDPGEFIEAVKADLFADEVYVFTPGGDIHTFPKGATPIDLAFAIHSDVGLTCSGARVNGQVVPLRYRLRQGDTVEILTNPNNGPREEWLKMCASSRARARIKQHLRAQRRESMRVLGRDLVEQALVGHGLDDDADETAAIGERLGLAKGQRTVDGIYEAVGEGQLSAESVAETASETTDSPRVSDRDGNLLTRVFRRVAGRAPRKDTAETGATPSKPIVVTQERIASDPKGGGASIIHLAPCCSPVPGDPLVGCFEAGRGIIVHVETCPQTLERVAQRRVHLTWDPALTLEAPVTLEVRTANKVGLLAEMSRAFSQHGVNIKQANCRTSVDGSRATNTFHATVGTLQQLGQLIGTLKTIPGVLGVERVFTPGSGVYPRI